MSLSKILITYLISVPIFLIIDGVWLGVIAGGWYRKTLGHLLSSTVNWTAAIVFYLLFLVGLLVFSLIPGISKQSLVHTIALAALFGFVSYATYDLTNLATLKDWPLTVTIIDLIWGAFLSASTAAITYLIITRIFYKPV